MVHTLLAAIVIACTDGGSFEHRIERGADGALGGCKLSKEAHSQGAPRALRYHDRVGSDSLPRGGAGMCTFEAVTPAACSRLTLRLYPKQYKADPYAGLLWKVGHTLEYQAV